MEIVINGSPEIVAPCNIAELVTHKRLVTDSLVVELNQQIIKQEQWPFTSLNDGDRLELLSFVGGG